MKKRVLSAIVVAFLLLFGACSAKQEEPSVIIPNGVKETCQMSGSYISGDGETVIHYLLHLYQDGTLVMECHKNRAGTWYEDEEGVLQMTIDEASYSAPKSKSAKRYIFYFKDRVGDEDVEIKMQSETDAVEVAREKDEAMIKYYADRIAELVKQFENRNGEIIFYGGSNFVKWSSLEEDMAPYPVQNKSFGGSNDVTRNFYVDELIVASAPKILVTFNDTNNWTSGQSLEMVLTYREEMLNDLHRKLPNTVILYLSNTPNPLRYFGDYHEKCVQSDEWTREYCEEHEGFEYLDIVSALTKNGEPVEEYWISDQLHLSQEGYAALAPVVKEKLDEICERYGIEF